MLFGALVTMSNMTVEFVFLTYNAGQIFSSECPISINIVIFIRTIFMAKIN